MSAARAPRRVWAIVPAAGKGERFAASAPQPMTKQYAPLAGATVLEWSLRALLAEARVHRVVLVLAADDQQWPAVAQRLQAPKILTALGGARRQDTVLHGLELLASQAQPDDWVLVHDAARPCLNATDLRALLDALESAEHGAVLAAPIVDTVKRQSPGSTVPAVETVDRQGLWRALTPQVFRLGALRAALLDAAQAQATVTDEAQALERAGISAVLVACSPFNIKITRAEDLTIAAEILAIRQGNQMRIGQGTDVHAFGDGDHVVLAGVRIAHSHGVIAHSDGDVIIHALCDAILGALGAGDIGQHFPDTDAQYRNADSRVFLRSVAQRMRSHGWRLANADITVLAESPRVGPHRSAMAANLAADLDVAPGLINIKATTTEKLGFIGRKEGLAATAAVLLMASQ